MIQGYLMASGIDAHPPYMSDRYITQILSSALVMLPQ